MADEPLVIRGINWRETFPWTNIFRGFRVAIHPSKLMLALAAIVIIFLGGRIWTPCGGRNRWPFQVKLSCMNRMEATPLPRSALTSNSVESQYADLLTEYKVVTNRDDATKAAEAREHRGELKDKIIAARNDAVKAADEEYNKAIDASKNASDPKAARKMADDMHRAAINAAYMKANGPVSDELDAGPGM